MKWLAAAAGLGVIIFSFGYAIYYIIRGGGCGLRLCMQGQEKMRQAQRKLISSGPVNSLAGKSAPPFFLGRTAPFCAKDAL